MFDFENAGAAPVEAADARCLSLAEFAVVSAQEIHRRDDMSSPSRSVSILAD